MTSNWDDLRRVTVLADLPDTAIQAFAKHCHWHVFSRDEILTDHLDADTDVYFILEGQVCIDIYSPSGRRVSFADLHAGETIGIVSAIDGLPRSARVTAAVQTRVARATAEAFDHLMAQYPIVVRAVLKDVATIIRRTTDRVFELTTLTSNYRILAELLRLARSNQVTGHTAVLSPAPRQNDIADRCSSTRETVARMFSLLSKRGIIRRAPGTLYISDLDQLADLVEEYRDV